MGLVRALIARNNFKDARIAKRFARFGVTQGLVYKERQAAHISPHNRAISQLRRTIILRELENETPLREITRKWHVSRKTVGNIVWEANYRDRLIVKASQTGTSIRQIANRWKIPESTVKDILESVNQPVDPRLGRKDYPRQPLLDYKRWRTGPLQGFVSEPFGKQKSWLRTRRWNRLLTLEFNTRQRLAQVQEMSPSVSRTSQIAALTDLLTEMHDIQDHMAEHMPVTVQRLYAQQRTVNHPTDKPIAIARPDTRGPRTNRGQKPRKKD
jgi:hypothetical protein